MANSLWQPKDDLATAFHEAQTDPEHALAHLARVRAPGKPYYLTGAQRWAWVERRGSGPARPRLRTAQPPAGEPSSGYGLLVAKRLME
jgi:hypothetical protein